MRWSPSLMQHWSAPKLFMKSSSQSLIIVSLTLDLFVSFLIQQLTKFQAFFENYSCSLLVNFHVFFDKCHSNFRHKNSLHEARDASRNTRRTDQGVAHGQVAQLIYKMAEDVLCHQLLTL